MVDQHAVKQNEEIREIGKGQIMQGFVDHSKKFGFFFFCPRDVGKSLKGNCIPICKRQLQLFCGEQIVGDVVGIEQGSREANSGEIGVE